MSVNYREPQWLLPNEKNLQYPAAGATQGSGLTADRHSLYSMYFNVDHRIDLGSSINLGVNSSISFWYKTSTNNNGSVVFGESTYSYEYLLQWGSSVNKIYFRIGSVVTDFTGITEIEDGNWHHYCIIRTGANAELFVDGASRGTVTGLPTGTNTLIDTIGATPSGTHTIDNSYLDEIAFWSRSLSSDEVTTLYNSGSPSNPMLLSGKPVAYYPLGEQARKPGTAEWRFPNEVLQGQAIDFDGTDNINSEANISSVSSFTASIWINRDDSATQYIYGQWVDGTTASQSWVVQTVGGIVYFNVRDASLSVKSAISTTSLITGIWYNIIAVWTGSNIKLYINNSLEDTTACSSMNNPSTAVKLAIGSSSNNVSPFNGKISNAVIWNSDQESNRDNIYNYGAPQTSYTVTPTAWYKLDKTSKFTGLNPNWHNALDFNGSSDYIDVGNVLNFERTDAFSISAWCYFDGTGTMSIFSKLENTAPFRGYSLFQSSTSVLNFYLTNNNLPSNRIAVYANLPSPTTSAWKHVVVTYDGSSNASGVNFYVNGSILSKTISIDTLSATIITSTNANIGARASVSEFFNGQISNLAIFNQAISAEDVKYLYNGGTPQTNISFEPVSWWKLDNLTTGIQDSGSASNNGTNNGATEVTDSVAVDQWNFDNAVQSQTPNWSSALSFDDTNDYIDCGNNSSLQISTDISISCWFKCTTDGIIISKGQYAGETAVAGWNYFLSIGAPTSTTTTINWSWYTTSSEGSSTGNRIYYLAVAPKDNVTDGNWHNIVATRSSTGSSVWLDGVYIANNGGNISSDLDYMVNSSQNVTIGTASDLTNYFGGELSNIQIWNTVLTEADALSIYNSGQPNTTAFGSPVSWWKLDNTTTGIQDSGSASNNGTNNGATEIQTNVWTPRLNGESDTLPSTALVSSDLQFNSAYSSFSLNFNGLDDNLNVGDIDNSVGLSFSTWISTTSTNASNYQNIAWKRNGSTGWFIQYLYSSGTNAKIKFIIFHTNGVNSGSEITINNLQSGDWFNITLTYDGTDAVGALKLYSNGVQVYSNPSTLGGTGIAVNNDDLYFAGAASSAWLECKMDEIAMWSSALNQAQVSSIYNNGYPKDLTSLSPTNWWRLGEDAYFTGTNFTVPNQIIGGNNGVSSNLPYTALIADAPGSYAAGLGSSLALADRVGDAPLSTANSLSFNMTPVNRVSYPAGYVPTQADNVYSMDFDGASDYVQSSAVIPINSVSLWFKPDATVTTGASSGVLISFGTTDFRNAVYLGSNFSAISNELITITDQSLNYSYYAQASGTIDTNWHHLAIVHDGSKYQIYLDGSAVTTTGSTPLITSQQITIGARGNTTGSISSYFNGKIDEVAIFDYALSARQIKQDIYNGTTTGKTADLNNISNLTAPVAWYRMGD